MIYELGFAEAALKEWHKLDSNTKAQFKKKISEPLADPHVPSAKLRGSHARYKIKLRSSGFCLVYEVRDEDSIIVVMAVGKRDRNAVYKAADQR